MSERAVPHVRKFLGQRLRALRRQRGLNQERLGDGAALSGKFIGEVERGVVFIKRRSDWGYTLITPVEKPGRRVDQKGIWNETTPSCALRLCWGVAVLCASLGLADPATAFELEPFADFNSLIGKSTYSALGLTVGQGLSEKWTLQGRLTFSFLTFQVERDHRTVSAEAPAARPLLGVKYEFTPDMSLTVLGGGQIKETRFFGEKPPRRNDHGAVAELEFDAMVTSTTALSAAYNYSWGDETHWSRLALTRELLTFGQEKHTALALGMEAIGTVGRDFTEERAGVLLELKHKPTETELRFGIGVGHFSPTSGHGVAPYLSVNFSRQF